MIGPIPSQHVFKKALPLALVFLITGLLASPAWAWGGPNKLLTMMDQMATQMGQTQELTPEQVEYYKDKVKMLRQLMDQQLQQDGSLNPIANKALYDQINQYNQPLYDLYQNSKAKVLFDPHDINRN